MKSKIWQGGKVMVRSINRRPAVVSKIKYPQKRRPMGVLCVTLVAWLVNLPVGVLAQSSCPGIHVEILDIRNSTGNVACALFESPDGFPIEYLRSATYIIATKIHRTEASCDFIEIPPGTYAIAAIHDENMNGKLDTNWLGIPEEGYGFSNEAEGFSGAPTFSAASFEYHGGRLDLRISLHY
jgi:uncharacterized protein (DUF2141 family)